MGVNTVGLWTPQYNKFAILLVIKLSVSAVVNAVVVDGRDTNVLLENWLINEALELPNVKLEVDVVNQEPGELGPDGSIQFVKNHPLFRILI